MRRRRSILFALFLSILLLVLCIQYNASNEIGIQNSVVMSEFEPDEQQPLNKPLQPVAAPVLVPGTVRKIKKDDDMHFIEEMQTRKSRRTRLNAEPPQQQQPYVPPHRLIHIDFKGAPPKVAYLQKLFPLIKRFGGSGLLLEWEDMFPWTGTLSPMAAGNAYSRAEIKEILKLAAANNLEVIPLIQTFGHVEFALKLPDFAHLREVQESPQALCPSYNASNKFIEQMIDQVHIFSHFLFSLKGSMFSIFILFFYRFLKFMLTPTICILAAMKYSTWENVSGADLRLEKTCSCHTSSKWPRMYVLSPHTQFPLFGMIC